MARSFLQILTLCFGLFGSLSCNVEDEMDVFSDRGVQDDKSYLEVNASNLDTEIKSLAECRFASLSCYWMDLVNEKDLTGPVAFVNYVMKIGEMMSEVKSSDIYFSALEEIIFNNEEVCEDLLNTRKGIWEWDQQSNDFIKGETEEEHIVIKFPSENGDDALNAVFTISHVSIHGSSDIESVQFDIKIGEELVLSSNSNSTFNDKGFYDFVGFSFNPVPYSVVAELGIKENKASWAVSLKNDKSLIIGYDLLFEIEEEPVIISNSFNFSGVTFQTQVTSPSLYADLMQSENRYVDAREQTEALVDIMNAGTEIKVRYSSDNTIIALADVVAVKASNTDNWVSHLNLQYSDGTTGNDELYFEDFVRAFKSELNGVMYRFRSKFGI